MKRKWKPGDVAMVDSWRGKGQIAFRCGRGKEEPAWCVLDGADTRGLDDHDVIDARPLVVIDAEDREQVERLLAAMSRRGWTGLDDEAPTDMQAALREYADPKPPKPEEPTGLGAVVEDAEGVRWVRLLRAGDDSTADDWKRSYVGLDSDENWHHYADIDAVRVLSPGVTQ